MAFDPSIPAYQFIDTPNGPEVVVREDVVRKLTEPLLRVVQYMAEGRTMKWIAAKEFRSVEAIRSRSKRVNKLLGTRSMLPAYRILVLANIMILQ